VHSGQFLASGIPVGGKAKPLEDVGMLIDHAILGQGDWHMHQRWWAGAQVFVLGDTRQPPIYPAVPGVAGAGPRNISGGNVGYLPGLVNHLFHGAKRIDPMTNAGRSWRNRVMIRISDLKETARAAQLTDRSVLRDGLRQSRDDG